MHESDSGIFDFITASGADHFSRTRPLCIKDWPDSRDSSAVLLIQKENRWDFVENYQTYARQAQKLRCCIAPAIAHVNLLWPCTHSQFRVDLCRASH